MPIVVRETDVIPIAELDVAGYSITGHSVATEF